MKIGRDVDWTEWPSWKKFGSSSELRNPVHFESRSQPTTDAGRP